MSAGKRNPPWLMPTQKFFTTCHDAQESVVLEIYEGERWLVADNARPLDPRNIMHERIMGFTIFERF